MIRAALKSLLGRKLRLLMSTFAIVLGVAFVVGTLIFTDTLNRSFVSLFASTVGDVVVEPHSGDAPGGGVSTDTVPAALVDRLAEVPGAARADGQIGRDGVYVVDEDGKAIGGFGPPAIGGNWSDAPAGNGLEGLIIVEGREPRGPDEVVLDATTADKAGYDIGERVPLVTATDTANLEPTLVGIADFREGGSLNGATLAAFETHEAQKLFLEDKDAYTSVWVTAEDGVSQEELRDSVEKVVPDDYDVATGDDAAEDSASDLLQAISYLTLILLIFAGISLVVGSFLIVNTFSILVAQRSRELALLRALGASKKQVIRSVQIESFALGLLGSTLGLGFGVLLAIGLRALFANFGLDLSGQALVFSARTPVAAYSVGVVVTMAAAYLPARRTTRIAPVQAMGDDVALPEASLQQRFRRGLLLALLGGASVAIGLDVVLDVGGGPYFTGFGVLAILLGVSAMSPVIARPFLAATRAVYARIFGAIGNLAGQNSLRNPRRTAATASALMIGLTLACTMAIVGDSLKSSVDESVADTFVGDFVVTSVFQGQFSARLADRVAAVDGVADVVEQRAALATYDGGFEPVIATDAEDLDRFGLTFANGRASDLRDGTVIVRDSFADDEGLEIGDTVSLMTASGEVQWRVAGTYEQSSLVPVSLVTNLRTFEKAGYPKQDTLLLVYEAAGATGVQDGLDEALSDQPIVTAKNEAEFAAEQRKPVDQLVQIVFALLGLALVIAVLGIVNTLALSIIERTREIGLLRAVGVTRGQLRRMITLESVVISVLGAGLGVVLGIGFGLALMYVLLDEGLQVISVPWGQVATFLLVSILIGVLAAVLPARRAARLDVLEAISTE